MSGFIVNAIINRTGSIPGATQGDFADIPAAGAQVGDWYLAIDTEVLYRWDGAAWIAVLQGSAGSTPDLKQVTDVGYVTSNPLYAEGFGQAIKSVQADYNALPGDFTILIDTTSVNVQVALPKNTNAVYAVKWIKGSHVASVVVDGGGFIDTVHTITFLVKNDSIMVQGNGATDYVIIANKN